MIKKLLLAIALITTIAGGAQSVAAASEDLCNGTGGNGQITNIGASSFTLAQPDGANITVNLRDTATIKTTAGPAHLSDLKIGDRVTLVGDANQENGTFSADTIVLCSGGSNTTQLKNNAAEYQQASSVIQLVTIGIVGVIWLGLVVFLLLKKHKSWVYILLFTIFYFYLYKVIDYTLLQFQLLLVLKHFVPDLMLNGIQNGKSINLIPLITLRAEDIQTSLLNIVMLVPFGLGLPFITNLRMKHVVIAGALFSVGIEFMQLVTGLMGHTTFRVADINDVLFNTLGAAIGYTLFVGIVRTVNRMPHAKLRANPLVKYIIDRPQLKSQQK